MTQPRDRSSSDAPSDAQVFAADPAPRPKSPSPSAPSAENAAEPALPLGRSAVPRDAERRGEANLLAELRADPVTAVVEVSAPHVRLASADTLRLSAPDDVVGAEGEWFYLGRDAERSYVAFARAVPLEASAATREQGWASLREAGALLDDRGAGLATTAVALASWRRTHRHCPRCGAPTTLTEAGWSARCDADGSQHYPRTDPAVIMAVHDGADRLLLAHSAAWPERRRSVLAGFVEAGEGLEQAVRREVAEEVGLAVGRVDYSGAQPWPFPGSLMIGFHTWVDGDGEAEPPVPDGVEITEADWFTRASLTAAVASGEVLLPGRTSIARALIEQWFGGPVEPQAVAAAT